MKLHHSKITPTVFAATSAAAGYPATNVGREALGHHWRSTSVAGTTNLDQTWATAATVAAILVSDANFATCTVHTSTDGSAWSGSIGTLSTHADKTTGRRRGIFAVNTAGLRGIRLGISGAPTDGLAYWRIGAAHLFATTVTLPRDPEIGTRVRTLYAQLMTELPNRQASRAGTGLDLLTLVLPFQREYNEDCLELVRRARAGTVGIELNNTDYPELALPVRHHLSEAEEAWSSFRQTETTIELREVA